MSGTVRGHVALVTGSTKGLGKAIALELGRAGAKVVLNYRNDDAAARRAFAEFTSAGCEGMLVRADVSTEGDVEALRQAAADRLGDVDIVVVNATPSQPQLPIEEYAWAHFQAMIDFFIKSPFLLTKAFLPSMKKKQWGRIINIGSEVFQRGVGNFSAYVSAKGGQAGFTRGVATELAPFGVTVNLVAPGWVPVERHENDPQAIKDAYKALIPAGRWGLPQDVADAVHFFASEEASFVTGQCLCVNGGLTPM